MFQVGQEVVCIDDEFPELIHKIYESLPEEGKTYTVRAVYVARGKVASKNPGSSDGEIGVLLNELKNPQDPMHMGQGELGFNAMRFASMQELSEDEIRRETNEKEIEHA